MPKGGSCSPPLGNSALGSIMLHLGALLGRVPLPRLASDPSSGWHTTEAKDQLLDLPSHHGFHIPGHYPDPRLLPPRRTGYTQLPQALGPRQSYEPLKQRKNLPRPLRRLRPHVHGCRLPRHGFAGFEHDMSRFRWQPLRCIR